MNIHICNIILFFRLKLKIMVRLTVVSGKTPLSNMAIIMRGPATNDIGDGESDQ